MIRFSLINAGVRPRSSVPGVGSLRKMMGAQLDRQLDRAADVGVGVVVAGVQSAVALYGVGRFVLSLYHPSLAARDPWKDK